MSATQLLAAIAARTPPAAPDAGRGGERVGGADGFGQRLAEARNAEKAARYPRASDTPRARTEQGRSETLPPGGESLPGDRAGGCAKERRGLRGEGCAAPAETAAVDEQVDAASLEQAAAGAQAVADRNAGLTLADGSRTAVGPELSVQPADGVGASGSFLQAAGLAPDGVNGVGTDRTIPGKVISTLARAAGEVAEGGVRAGQRGLTRGGVPLQAGVGQAVEGGVPAGAAGGSESVGPAAQPGAFSRELPLSGELLAGLRPGTPVAGSGRSLDALVEHLLSQAAGMEGGEAADLTRVAGERAGTALSSAGLSGAGGQGSALLQTLAGRPLADAGSLNLPQPFGAPDWGRGVGERVMWMLNSRLGSAQLQLDPPELGALNVRIIVQQDQASLSFSSPHAAVREALEQQIPRLREQLAESGLSLGDVDVSDQSLARDSSGSGAFAESGQNGPGSATPEGSESLNEPGWQPARPLGLVDYYA